MESINSDNLKLQDEFQSASSKKRTGILQVLCGDDEYKILYQNGRIIDIETEKGFIHHTCKYLNEAEFVSKKLEAEYLNSYDELYSKIEQDSIASAVCDKDLFKQFLQCRINEMLYNVLSFDGGYASFKPQGVIRSEFQPSISVGQLLLNSLSFRTEKEFLEFDWNCNLVAIVKPTLEFDKPDQRILQFSRNNISVEKLKKYSLLDKYNFVITVNELIKLKKLEVAKEFEESTQEDDIFDVINESEENLELSEGHAFNNIEIEENKPYAPRILEELASKKLELKESLSKYYQKELSESRFLKPQVIVSFVIFCYLLVALCAPFTIWHKLFLMF